MKKLETRQLEMMKGGNYWLLRLACAANAAIFWGYRENYTLSDDAWYAAGDFVANYC